MVCYLDLALVSLLVYDIFLSYLKKIQERYESNLISPSHVGHNH